MQTLDSIAIKIGEVQFMVPPAVAARGFLEMVTPERAMIAASVTVAPIAGLPAIGVEWKGGIYAGLSLADNAPVALVLLPGDEELNWKDAVAWAEKKGGSLPSRIDHLVLFKNLKQHFKQEYYWSSEEHASASASAWLQFFYYGLQYYWHKDGKYRARSVRRFPI